MSACSSSGDGESSAITVPTTLPLPTEAECREAAAQAVVPLQAFIDEYEGLTADEWNALDPPPDVAEAQNQVVVTAQGAIDRGCSSISMEELLGDQLGQLEGDGEVGEALAAALRGEGPMLGPPAPVPVTLPPRETEPSTVVIEPGDDLTEALIRVAPGSTIEFSAGTHEFVDPILVDVDLTFVGAGRDETIISSTAEGVAVAFVGPGGFEVSDLTIEHTGEAEASVLLAIEGPLTVEDVVIRGAVAGSEQAGGGHGIVFAYENLEGFPERTDAERAGRLVIRDTIVTGNASAGILATGKASPQITRVTSSDNGGCGVCFVGSSGGSVTDSTIQRNQIGVQLADASAPLVDTNTIVDNIGVGVSIDGESTVTVMSNLIERNGDIGVQITGSSSPLIEENTITQHGVGILAGESATPTVRSNGIARQEIGIQVGGDAEVEASGNTVWVSSVAAISFAETSGGVAFQNAIADAPEVAIQVVGDASAELRENTIESEGAVGISFVDAATGLAVGNDVRDRAVGVQVGGTADADIVGNTILDSGDVGILFGGETTSRAAENQVSSPEAIGMMVAGAAAPFVQDNLISQNSVGLVYREQASGTATGNTIDQHGVGVQVVDESSPQLRFNTIIDNVDAGIAFGGSTTAVFNQNTLARNGNSTIQIAESARPTVAGNELRGEGIYGIVLRDTSGGVVRDNRVIDFVFGIQLNDSAAPDLIGNSLENIALTGIAYADSSGGTATRNTCGGSALSAVINVTAPAAPILADNNCTINRG